MKRCMDVEIGGGGTGADLETIRRRGFEVDGCGGGGGGGLEIYIGLHEIHGEPVTVEAVMKPPQVCTLVTCGVCH